MKSRVEEIHVSVREVLSTIPTGVTLVAAAKTRTLEDVKSALDAGITVFGYNYVQEAQGIINEIGAQASWHMIGHLQRNKAKVAVGLFDMVQTVDSIELAQALEKQCVVTGKTLPVLIEVNSAREPNKAGVYPEDVPGMLTDFGNFSWIRVKGLMTMGPLTDSVEAIRPYFKLTRRLFEDCSTLQIGNVNMLHLSMGMSDSYRVAIEEGATMVRIGTMLFGERRK